MGNSCSPWPLSASVPLATIDEFRIHDEARIGTAIDDVEHVPQSTLGHADVALFGMRGVVRRENDIRKSEQRILLGGGLLGQDVKPGCLDGSFL